MVGPEKQGAAQLEKERKEEVAEMGRVGCRIKLEKEIIK